MESAHCVLRLLALSQVVLLCLNILVYQRHTTGKLAALTLFGFGCYLIGPFADNFHIGSWVIRLVSTACPTLLWLLARHFFCDDRGVPLWLWLVTALYLGLSMLRWSNFLPTSEPGNLLLIDLLPQLAKLGLVIHVFYMAIEGRANDLVDQRLKLRVPIAIGGSALTTIIILVEISASGPVPMLVEVVGSGLMLSLCMGANVYLLRLRDDFPLAIPAAQVSTQAEAPEPLGQAVDSMQADLERIRKVMTEGRFYANHGAKLSNLAELLSIVEHRLRPMVNKEMGFRNFNQFLNTYRIAEATKRLVDEPKPPILTIALDVGFQSLSSFNKAFKEKHGKTPTEFRAQRT